MKKNQDYFNESVSNAQKAIFGGRFVINDELSRKYGLKIYDDLKSDDNMLYVLDWGECYTEDEIIENLK